MGLDFALAREADDLTRLMARFQVGGDAGATPVAARAGGRRPGGVALRAV